MAQEGCKFSGGIEKANLILSTGILQISWGVIYKLQQSPDLRFHVEKLPKFTILAFSADQSQLAQEASPQSLDKNDPTFGFLATKKNPSFSIHSSPLSAFRSLLETTDLEEQLEALTAAKQPRLILVGESLGGSIAALCTLWLPWLLKDKVSPLVLPICVTFGSPLLGDDGLQKAVSDLELWKTHHFWHVAGHGDPIPRLFLTGSFRPFGTYFLVSGSTCACFDDPDLIVELLKLGCPDISIQIDFKGYGAVLQQLKEKRKYRINAPSAVNPQDSFNAGLSLQLAAAGVGTNHQNGLLQALEKWKNEIHNRRKKEGNPSKKLNDIKKYMAQLEWYIRDCNSKNLVYYDCYKGRSSKTDMDVKRFKEILKKYWHEKVLAAESKPQAPDTRMRTRWLFSGVTYMRMVEPLDIAEHYRIPPDKDYLSVRAERFNLLDKWNGESRTGAKKKDKAPILTEDSCFWARVEEAKLKLDKLRITAQGSDRENQLKKELIEFEAHIMKLVNNYELSPEVFFEKSSFMEWWRQYDSMNPANTSSFAYFMKDEAYKNYK